jgi:hypothetical protein
MRGPALALILLLAPLLLICETAGQAQEPPPPVPPGTPVRVGFAIDAPCASLPLQYSGGQVITYSRLAITLPTSGSYALSPLPGPYPGSVRVCHVDSESSVVLNQLSGEPQLKVVASLEGDSLLNQIVASIRAFPAECDGFARARGGDTVTMSGPQSIRFVLPGSGDYLWSVISGDAFMLCHLDTASSIAIDFLPRLEESSRIAINPEGEAILDQILAVVKAARLSILPPDTGDAGLR